VKGSEYIDKMVNLNIKKRFRASHGTQEVRWSNFEVEIEMKGHLSGDFMKCTDYDHVRSRISTIIDPLQGRYLDNIVGRGTIENIASFFMFNLRGITPFRVSVQEDSVVTASVFYNEARWDNYLPLLHFKVGASKMVRGLYIKALADFNNVLKFNQDLPEVINCRGRVYKYLNRFDLALKDHSKAIELNPKFGEAYRNRGNDHYYLGNFGLMMKDFDEAVNLMPFSALVFNNRGFALQHFALYEEAVTDHNRAIELDQNYAEAYSDRAQALRNLGKSDQAIIDEEQAKRLAPLQNRFNLEWEKITWPSLKEDGLKFLLQPD